MTTTSVKRVNITLPVETLSEIDQVTTRGNRSRFIAQAVSFYVKEVSRKNMAAALKEGAIHQSKRDLDISAQWFNLDEETWQKNT